MQLKPIVDNLLKERGRSLSWLAVQIGKTFDGFRLSLIKESIKYTDLKKMAEILEVSPSVFFQESTPDNYPDLPESKSLTESVPEYRTVASELNVYKQLTETLKGQLKDKEKIIELLNSRSQD
ncbi:hypothetical protein [Pseudopedobacter beijingensis]|uniref:HTH cro/C1-type domain-containing protein n=1 Tax=Pseudopedobacter beijingensis TaxID=1207056 RepID=A0ABW4IB40_9SPHI